MKRFALLIAIVSFIIWPIRFISENIGADFTPKHIFALDYQAQQLVLRNINIYPSVPLARIFQNKALIVTNKYITNMFNFFDPNYYYFGSHPREVHNGQNYTRLPLFTIVPILLFFFKSKHRYKKTLVMYSLGSIFVLSFFVNHHLYDFMLWPIFFYAIYNGLETLRKQNVYMFKVLSLLLLIEIFYEYSIFLK
jgi:hypothetical protein